MNESQVTSLNLTDEMANSSESSTPINQTELECMNLDQFLFEMQGDLTAHADARLTFALLYALIFLFGVGGNMFVVLAVAKNKQLQTVRNFFLVNLSASDIVVCLTSLPVTPYTIMFKRWEFGEPLCYAIPLIQGMSIIISTFTLTAIAIDRFILIVHPTRRPIQKYQAVAMIAAIWAIGASLSVPMVLNYKLVPGSHFQIGDGAPICGWFCDEVGWSGEQRKIYGCCVLIIQFVIPLSLITFCYAKIVQKLNAGMGAKKLNVQRAQRTSVGSVLSERQIAAYRRKQRTNRMLISMVALFASVWFLQVLMTILRDFEALPEFVQPQQYLASLFVHCIAMTSTVWNPILYGGLNESFREAFFDMLPRFVKTILKRTRNDLKAKLRSTGTEASNEKLNQQNNVAETNSLLLNYTTEDSDRDRRLSAAV